ncbi:MAG TPA: hypothetical protein VF423_05640 [Actinomycetes bacterium]
MGPDEESWRDRRTAAAEEHAATLARRRAAEEAQARQQLDAFVQTARDRGLQTAALRARAFSGRSTYRTGLTGWYLKRNGSLGVDTDGRFYVLSTPTSLRSRLSGAVVEPSDPPLIVGVGGRDGESMPLADLLALRLDAGDDWPPAR